MQTELHDTHPIHAFPELLDHLQASLCPIEYVSQLGHLIAIRWDGKPCGPADSASDELSLAVTTETEVKLSAFLDRRTGEAERIRTYRAVGLVTGRLIHLNPGHTVFAFHPSARLRVGLSQ